MNISLPDPLKNFVDEQVEQRGYSTSSEYERELIRKDQDRQHLKNLLLEGAKSPLTTAMDAEYLEALRVRARLAGCSFEEQFGEDAELKGEDKPSIHFRTSISA